MTPAQRDSNTQYLERISLTLQHLDARPLVLIAVPNNHADPTVHLLLAHSLPEPILYALLKELTDQIKTQTPIDRTDLN